MLLFSPTGNPSGPAHRTFDELRADGRRAVEAGHLTEALELFEKALGRARDRDDERLVDLSICNRSVVLISLGRPQEVMPELRQILVRNPDAMICSIAAYNLSRAHECSKEYKKGLFYGRIARDRALAAGREDLLVGSYNLIGNCLMSDSYFAEAAEEYAHALELLPDEPSQQRAMVIANLGYCRMMLSHVREGMRMSFQALRWFRRFGARLYEVWPRLDLCYAYLELGRYRRAMDHGLHALAIAEETGEVEAVKIALYLVGETERSAGDVAGAVDTFSLLQERFYPESPEIVELMAQVGLRQVVNLRA
ncbi:MAG: hypothetical protein GY719_18335 [bacterium]|nr:hypothetical protein [bacterium]